MFPGGMNPKNMQRIMKQMGIKSEELEVKKVVFELPDRKLVIDNPSVTAIEMQGQKTFQVMGEVNEESKELEIPEDDVKLVMEQANVSKEKAESALNENEGDIAEAITKLKGE